MTEYESCASIKILKDRKLKLGTKQKQMENMMKLIEYLHNPMSRPSSGIPTCWVF